MQSAQNVFWIWNLKRRAVLINIRFRKTSEASNINNIDDNTIIIIIIIVVVVVVVVDVYGGGLLVLSKSDGNKLKKNFNQWG